MHRELLVFAHGQRERRVLDAFTSGRVRPALIALDDELARSAPASCSSCEGDYVSSDGVFYFPKLPKVGTLPAQPGSSSVNTAP